MTPAQPPLPTAWNLPFHFSSGSHTSISMCESDEGVSTMATRQRGGTRDCAPYGPAGTDSAAVIVVFGNDKDFSFSHVVPELVSVANNAAAVTAIISEPPSTYTQNLRHRSCCPSPCTAPPRDTGTADASCRRGCSSRGTRSACRARYLPRATAPS